MRILFINVCLGRGSTGKIAAELATELEREGNDVVVAYGTDTVPEKYMHFAHRIGNKKDIYEHAISTRLFDNHGLASKRSTKDFLTWADEFNPDVLWLHNIHGYYINYEMLFNWIKQRPQMMVKWTLHDCWAFTGHCAYFTYARCNKWMNGCNHCKQKNVYPASLFFDRSRKNYEAKKTAFTNVKNMQLITPSIWLAELVEQSFLREYPIEVRYNNIDNDVFKPTPSDFKEKHHLIGKIIVLGVASPWSKRKGLEDFIKLSSMLDDRFRIVLVGLSNEQIKKAPANILALPRTNSANQLAEIYTAADVFFNPTYEDNYPTTNLEARACGTPCITYKTGGSPESVEPENVFDQGDLNSVIFRIMEITISQNRG